MATPRRRYGSIPSKPDERDGAYKYKARFRALPPSTNNRAYWGRIENQGNLGSCTSNGLTSIREYYEVRAGRPYVDLSRLALYYWEREIEGTINVDAGAEPRDGLKVMARGDKGIGVPPESDWAYDISRFKERPPQIAYDHAKQYQIESYHSIPSPSLVLDALASGDPVAIGFAVYESFEQEQNMTTGRMPMPKKGESIVGYHLTAIADFEKDDTYEGGYKLITANSWGTGVHDKGWYYTPIAYLSEPGYTTDLWVMSLTEQPVPPQPPGDGCLAALVARFTGMKADPYIKPNKKLVKGLDAMLKELKK